MVVYTCKYGRCVYQGVYCNNNAQLCEHTLSLIPHNKSTRYLHPVMVSMLLCMHSDTKINGGILLYERSTSLVEFSLSKHIIALDSNSVVCIVIHYPPAAEDGGIRTER